MSLRYVCISLLLLGLMASLISAWIMIPALLVTIGVHPMSAGGGEYLTVLLMAVPLLVFSNLIIYLTYKYEKLNQYEAAKKWILGITLLMDGLFMFVVGFA